MMVDYNYYAAVYKGSKVTESEFDECCAAAERFVDYLTDGRALVSVDNKVRNAICAATEAYFSVRQRAVNTPLGVKSENTDGYSVTYTDNSAVTIRHEQDIAMTRAVQRELSGTGLLYRGVK